MTLRPFPTEFWVARDGAVYYVERYDNYRRKLIVVNESGEESERNKDGTVGGGRSYDDLTQELIGCTSFPMRKKAVR